MYTNGGPEHHSTFLSVKIALIALQSWLNLDMINAARTAPGHSYKNLAKKINCILNIGLYGIGCMHQPCPDAEFKRKAKKYSGLQDVRKAINRLLGNRKLFEDTCAPCIDLIADTFQRLKLKGEMSLIRQAMMRLIVLRVPSSLTKTCLQMIHLCIWRNVQH